MAALVQSRRDLRKLLKSVSQSALPLSTLPSRFDSLLERAHGRTCVLLGEATHGTHEFYKARAELTKRLIAEQGFTIVACEADWPDALRLNRYIRGQPSDAAAVQALGDFRRFPNWMWRNTEIVDLIEWLKDYNSSLDSGSPRAGLYGLDLYSLHSSMNEVIAYLEKVNPQAAAEARKRYSCFEEFGEDPQSYGLTASAHRSLSCEEEVVKQLLEVQSRGTEFLQHDGKLAEDELFYAQQNALVTKNAEAYYRAMYRGRPNTWNLRDTHMADTLDALLKHASRGSVPAKAVVWAHNSHLGDARATEMSRRGELNVGQLVRERHGESALLVGFTTHSGTVTAASDWGAVTERKRVRPALNESFEDIFHQVDSGDFLLHTNANEELERQLNGSLIERAIGVIYRPETERYSHYFFADLAGQFDAVIHFDQTRALEPLDRTSEWDKGELPETYPSGF